MCAHSYEARAYSDDAMGSSVGQRPAREVNKAVMWCLLRHAVLEARCAHVIRLCLLLSYARACIMLLLLAAVSHIWVMCISGCCCSCGYCFTWQLVTIVMVPVLRCSHLRCILFSAGEFWAVRDLDHHSVIPMHMTRCANPIL